MGDKEWCVALVGYRAVCCCVLLGLHSLLHSWQARRGVEEASWSV